MKIKMYAVVFSFAFTSLVHSMGDGEEAGVKQGKSFEPSYAPLEEKAGKFQAKIVDDGNVILLDEVSFFGHTTVGGVRKETDDSMNKLDLSHIQKIEVVKPDFDSIRYPEKSFTVVKVLTTTGVAIDQLLAPKHVIVCGIEKDSEIQKAWFLHKLKSIEIVSAAAGKGVTAKQYVDKIFKEEPAAKAGEPVVVTVKPAETVVVKVPEEKVVIVKEVVQKAVIPVDMPPAKPEKKTIKEAFSDMIVAVVDLVKAMWNGIMKLLPV